MTTNSHQPWKYDVVISNDSNALANDAVLGGLERIKQLVAHGRVEQKIDALLDAFEYGNSGLDLIIQALQNSEVDVTEAAYNSLKLAVISSRKSSKKGTLRF